MGFEAVDYIRRRKEPLPYGISHLEETLDGQKHLVFSFEEGVLMLSDIAHAGEERKYGIYYDAQALYHDVRLMRRYRYPYKNLLTTRNNPGEYYVLSSQGLEIAEAFGGKEYMMLLQRPTDGSMRYSYEGDDKPHLAGKVIDGYFQLIRESNIYMAKLYPFLQGRPNPNPSGAHI